MMDTLSRSTDKHSEGTKRGAPMATILLIEDDGAVRRVLRQMLLGQGHEVIEAAGAPEAIQAAAGWTAPIELVITDVVMPQSNCDGLIAQLREARPDLKAVLISGYTEDMLSEYGVDMSSRPNFLRKPFTTEQRRAKVREALGDGEALGGGKVLRQGA